MSLIEQLYAQIPAFKCRPGCSACCGPVPFARAEWDRIADKRQHKTLKCPYVGANGCDIYELRPLMCRLFGAVASGRLVCPFGCTPIFPLPEQTAIDILAKYHQIMDNEVIIWST